MFDLEIDIIRRVKSGDIKAFEEIVKKYKDKALTLSTRILKNTEDAEDSLQEAFIKTYRAIVDNQFEERSKFSTYFYRIVYNSAIDYYKKHKAKNFNLISIDEPHKDGDEEYDNSFVETKIDMDKYSGSSVFSTDKKTFANEMQMLINKYLELIPEKYSAILTMFYINDLSHDEIAEALKLPLGTVKNRIFRAKDKLKEIILGKYSEEEILELI